MAEPLNAHKFLGLEPYIEARPSQEPRNEIRKLGNTNQAEKMKKNEKPENKFL